MIRWFDHGPDQDALAVRGYSTVVSVVCRYQAGRQVASACLLCQTLATKPYLPRASGPPVKRDGLWGYDGYDGYDGHDGHEWLWWLRCLLWLGAVRGPWQRNVQKTYIASIVHSTYIIDPSHSHCLLSVSTIYFLLSAFYFLFSIVHFSLSTFHFLLPTF